jgi:RNA-directed DNA polymerase
MRPLGIPTVGDRVAQGVLKARLEAKLDPLFHRSSYGYRPGRSAHDAIQRCKDNCKHYSWVIDLDIKGFFDNISHEWMLKMVANQTTEKSMLLYVERWLKSKVQLSDGSIEERTKGTPQGGVISPLLSNLYLHHAFDMWMEKHYTSYPFERYADDIVIHCNSIDEATSLLAELRGRLAKFDLELHSDKTKIVYCKDDRRNRHHEHESFTFLSFSFQPRVLKNKTTKKLFMIFLPAISEAAKTNVRKRIREVFNPRWTDVDSKTIATMLNSRIRGWCNYCRKSCPHEMKSIYFYIDERLREWIRNKFRVGVWKSVTMLQNLMQISKGELFYHWKYYKLNLNTK